MNIKRIVVGLAGTLAIGLTLAIAPTMNATASAPPTPSTVETNLGSSCESRCDHEYRDCLENGGSQSTCEADWIDCMWDCQ